MNILSRKRRVKIKLMKLTPCVMKGADICLKCECSILLAFPFAIRLDEDIGAPQNILDIYICYIIITSLSLYDFGNFCLLRYRQKPCKYFYSSYYLYMLQISCGSLVMIYCFPFHWCNSLIFWNAFLVND